MKNYNRLAAIAIIAVALGVAFVIVGGVPLNMFSSHAPQVAVNAPAPATNSTSTPSGAPPSAPVPVKKYTPHPPHGTVTYEVAEAATRLPNITQATIDPVDVAVGQTQTFKIVTNDINPVVSVVAQITTDHKVITIPLVSKGAPSLSLLVPRTVSMANDGQLALVTPNVETSNLADTHSGTNIANAADSLNTEFVGQWKVEDTHSAKYQTTFIAKDSAGNENSVTLQWTDPCPFSVKGSQTISASCEMAASGMSPVDGPESGSLSFSGGATLQIDSGATLVINNGYQINAANGTIAVASGAQILFGKDMCGTDNDGDGYITQSGWTAAATCSSPMVSRANAAGITGIGDCNDSDARAHPNGYYQTTAEVGTPGSGGAWDFDCNGSVTYQYPIGSYFHGQYDSCGGCSCALNNGVLAIKTLPACGTVAGYYTDLSCSGSNTGWPNVGSSHIVSQVQLNCGPQYTVYCDTTGPANPPAYQGCQ
jgi:hypothetical protein